jgi:3-hydroxyacyl-[acyl-carrier-protein] dehydratase
MLNIDEIQKILPQKYPFLMLDRVTELEPQKKVVALKNVSFNEGYFQGHFPGKPVMPGVMIIEAMAQAAIVLFYSPAQEEKPSAYYLAAVKARFLQPVFPGDQLEITVEATKIISGGAIVDAVARVGEKESARAELTFSAKGLSPS